MTKYNYLPRKLYELKASKYFSTFEEFVVDRYKSTQNYTDTLEDLSNIRKYIVELTNMPDNEVIYLWERFSQNLRNCASYLYVDEASIDEFKEWLDEDDNEKQL